MKSAELVSVSNKAVLESLFVWLGNYEYENLQTQAVLQEVLVLILFYGT
jgi:hypothetical protein